MNDTLDLREDLVMYAKLAQHNTTPVAGQLELTSKCYQHCRMCESWRDDLKNVARGTFTFAEVKALLHQLSRFLSFEHLALTGGDPQHWPHLTELLGYYLDWKPRFTLQVNTALTQDVSAEDRVLWRDAFRDVRVSLDAVDTALYQKIRGDRVTQPGDVLRRVEQLAHPRTHILMCVTPDNLSDVTPLLDRVADLSVTVRKVSLLPVIGDRYERSAEFWEEYRRLGEAETRWANRPFVTSFSDSVLAVRRWTVTPEAAQVPCYVGKVTFHIKANGDWYPCCLVGGEALQTYKSMRMGNVFESRVVEILESYLPTRDYACADKPCREICQYKQAVFNLAVHRATEVTLTMP